MASIASPDYYQKEPIATIDANTIGTKNMLELATKQKVKSLVYTSTSECYGDSKIVPTPEVYWGNVNPNGIRSCYDEGKRCGEAYCLSFFRKYKTPVRIARIFNTYGPRLSAKEGSSYGRVIPRFIEQSLLNKDITIFGDGSQTRSFCYISDQINGLYKLLTVPNIDGEVINIGNTNEMTILQLAKSIIKLTNSSSNIVFTELPADDPKRRCADIRKAKKMLGWLPEVSLENGLTKTIDWFKNQVKT